jgi:hypothetical protein
MSLDKLPEDIRETLTMTDNDSQFTFEAQWELATKPVTMRARNRSLLANIADIAVRPQLNWILGCGFWDVGL